MPHFWEMIGYLGIAVSAIAYLPQITHLAKAHCSAGVSTRAWGLWMLSGLFIGAQAVKSGNPVFVALQAMNLAASFAIFLLGKRYYGQVCPLHAHGGAGR